MKLDKAAILAPVLSAIAFQPGFAQGATSSPTPSAPPAAVGNAADPTSGVPEAAAPQDEIVVTALRRQQNVLSVPLSIQASTGDQLVRAGIPDLTSLRFNTPGYTTASDSGFTQIFIRGIGNGIYVGADPSVSQFVDDVPRIYGSASDTLFNVARVEVLKGAQGGLYGRNSTGGVVNIITRQPSTDALTANFLGSYGEKNTLRLAAYLNVPLSDRIAISISAERDRHDGYIRNIGSRTPYTAAIFPAGAILPVPNGSPVITVPGGGSVYAYTPQQTADFFNQGVRPGPLNNQNFYAVDAKLLFQAADNLKFTLAGDFNRRDDTNGSGYVTDTPATFQASLAALFGAFGITTNLPSNFITNVDRKFTASNGVPNRTLYKEQGASATIVWSLPEVDLTSISAYRHQTTTFISDAGSTTVPLVPLDVRFDKRFIYQELRAISTFDGPWHVLGGATYLDNRQRGRSLVDLLVSAFPTGDTQVLDRVRNWSVYAQVGYDVTDLLNLTVSGRYQAETNRIAFSSPVASQARTKESKFVPSATLSYKLDGGGNVYARWARGFKTGGINTANAPVYYPDPATDGSIFGPETVDTYEVGYRNALFNRRVQLTAAVFYNDYRNLQVYAHPFFGSRDAFGNDATATITTAVVNAKSARTYGVEGTINWRVTDALALGVNAGYLNAKYRSFQLDNSTILAPINRNGKRLTNSPELQLSFNADLDQPISERLNFVASALISHNSSVVFNYSSSDFVPDNTGPGFWLVNARVGLKTHDGRFGIALVADNLFNHVYYIQGSSVSFGNNLAYGNPRIIRGEVTAKF